MRVRFTEPYDYTPSAEARVLIAFSPTGGANKDGVYTVRRECGEAAILAGKAEGAANIAPSDEPGSPQRRGLFGRRMKKTDAEA
ncbi:MAG TPA: hypothetical protein DCG71_05355 [Brevundimonas sp.]|nr:hypothetical protein [Brevundimonas sp.]